MYKGNEQSSSSEEEELVLERGLVVDSKIEVESLICSICHNILWEALSCGSVSGCHACFCSPCIEAWLARAPGLCPHCKCVFVRSAIPPVLRAILSAIRLKCVNQGCAEVVEYGGMSSHARACRYKLRRCQGCKEQVSLQAYDHHTDHCDRFIVACARCGVAMPKRALKEHAPAECIQNGVDRLGERMAHLQYALHDINQQATRLEDITKCFLSGDPLQLYISFYTTFNQHFVFPNPTLVKSSFNEAKHKFDFLHFYILTPISVNSIVSMKWAIKIQRMTGNILLGFCSTMNINSLDYIVNKYGELKRKNVEDVKYKIMRKNDFSFAQGDIIRCKYVGLMRVIEIENQTKKISLSLAPTELEEFSWGGKIYIFFSMDTLNDSISFIS